MKQETDERPSKELKKPHRRPTQPEIAERLTVASRLRDVQDKLRPIREANKAKRKAGRIKIRIKTA